MADTTFINSVTLTDASWFQDENNFYYRTLSAPTTAVIAKYNILSADRHCSVYQYTGWDPSDVAGTFTNAPNSAAATVTATDYITVANAAGTTTWTCVKAGLYQFSAFAQNKITAALNTIYVRLTLGGTATPVPNLALYPLSLNNASIFGGTNPMDGYAEFYANMTAGQTITILPALAVVSAGATTAYTQQLMISAQYTGT